MEKKPRNTPNTPLLELENLSAAYGPIQALRDVSLHVERGEIVTLIGANGAGKSTLLMTIFGNPRAQSGTIRFRGQEIQSRPSHEVATLGISQVPEGRRIFPGMTVVENLIMGEMPLLARNNGNGNGKGNQNGPYKESAMLDKVFSLFPRLKERERQRAGTLSGGEQQMLAIGRALMSQPELLLLDEPSLGLAPLVSKQIFHTLKEISKEGATIFLVEQNANQALRLADRGYVMANGSIEMQGTGKELLEAPEVRQAYLGGA